MKKWIIHLFIAFLGSTATLASVKNNKVVYFYNWSEYVPTGILEEFTKESGIKVIYSTYESNETMYAKLKTHKQANYDLIVPSSYFIHKMSKEGMLQKIDTAKLKHFKFLDPLLLNQSFDPGNQYSIPYIWGATGIGVNLDNIDRSTITSWAQLWDKKYKNSLLVLDDARELFFIALLKLGYSVNSTDSTKIQAAYEELRKLLPNIAIFNSDAPANPFIEGEVNIGMLWNGSAYIAQKEGFPLDVIWPTEGAILWMDTFAIPTNAQNVAGAMQLIDFLTRPDIAARIAEQIGYPTPNLEALKLLPKEVTDNPMLYPPKEIVEKSHWQNDVGSAIDMYELLYQKLKTQ